MAATASGLSVLETGLFLQRRPLGFHANEFVFMGFL